MLRHYSSSETDFLFLLTLKCSPWSVRQSSICSSSSALNFDKWWMCPTIESIIDSRSLEDKASGLSFMLLFPVTYTNSVPDQSIDLARFKYKVKFSPHIFSELFPRNAHNQITRSAMILSAGTQCSTAVGWWIAPITVWWRFGLVQLR